MCNNSEMVSKDSEPSSTIYSFYNVTTSEEYLKMGVKPQPTSPNPAEFRKTANSG